MIAHSKVSILILLECAIFISINTLYVIFVKIQLYLLEIEIKGR